MLENISLFISNNSDFRAERIWKFNLSHDKNDHQPFHSESVPSNQTIVVDLFNGIYVFLQISLIKYKIIVRIDYFNRLCANNSFKIMAVNNDHYRDGPLLTITSNEKFFKLPLQNYFYKKFKKSFQI